jgi:hypothetical protein
MSIEKFDSGAAPQYDPLKLRVPDSNRLMLQGRRQKRKYNNALREQRAAFARVQREKENLDKAEKLHLRNRNKEPYSKALQLRKLKARWIPRNGICPCCEKRIAVFNHCKWTVIYESAQKSVAICRKCRNNITAYKYANQVRGTISELMAMYKESMQQLNQLRGIEPDGIDIV